MIKIDPFAITNYNRTDEELEAFWLFCLAVAGKKATTMASKVDSFINLTPEFSPFTTISRMDFIGTLNDSLKRIKMGKYSLLEKGYSESANKGVSWFRTASAEDIRKNITGAGYKTSRFFTLHSRANEKVAVIDTHMLKYLNHIGASNVPKSIPTGNDYLRLEQVLLAEAARKNMNMADFDLAIWSHYSSGGKTPLP